MLTEGFYKDAEKVDYPIKTEYPPYDFTINYNLSQSVYGEILDTTPLYKNKNKKNNDFTHNRATYMEIQPHPSMINPEYEFDSTCPNKK